MAARLTLGVPLRSTGCSACRASTLRSFISNSARVGSSRAAIRPLPVSHVTVASRFASTTDAPSRPQPDTRIASSDRVPEKESREGAVESASKDGAEIPWYLQEEAPRHPTLVHEPTPVPELPHDPPRLLEPLLQFIADDLGLDDLNLLDLRALDPPPALGPKLVMLFGTARSERHLHVSAGSLVRWLRAKGITADADGLLGPNELKIRLRRKARKAKLMGGSGLAPSEDDGISTRWICVNLGTMGWTNAEAEVQSDDGRFSGFGTPQVGTTIVVQMFTEAKRKELDLETLWSRILRRSEDRQREEATPSLEGPANAGGRGTRRLSSPGQHRFFSTSTRRNASVANLTGDVPPEVSLPSLDDGRFPRIDEVLVSSADERVRVLSKLLKYLDNLPLPEGLGALNGHDIAGDSGSSGFLQLWNAALTNLPAENTWEHRARLHAHARKLHHPDYTLSGIRDLVQELLLSGYQPSQRKVYTMLLKAIFKASESYDEPLHLRAELAIDLLDAMHERGEPVITHDIIVSLINAIGRFSGPEMERLQSTLEKLLVQAKLPYMSDYRLMTLMETYASQGKWDKYWETWRIPPRYQVPRSEKMYTYMYKRMARTEHQSRCIDTVRWCFQEMLNENPPVALEGDVMEALKDCMRVADPAAEGLARLVVTDKETERQSKREFVKLWRILYEHENAARSRPQRNT